MTIQLWHWDNNEKAIVSDQGDHLAIEDFIMYVNGLEREAANAKDNTAPTACPDCDDEMDIMWVCPYCGTVADVLGQ